MKFSGDPPFSNVLPFSSRPLTPPTPPPLLPLSPFPPPRSSKPLHPQRFTSPKLLAGASKSCSKWKMEPSGSAKATQPCTECGKRFPSPKALFGHMRCHPERNWRGIKPPPQTSRSHFTDEEYDVAATLVLLANKPPSTVVISTVPSSFEGSIWGRLGEKGKRIRQQWESGGRSFRRHLSPSPSSSSRYCGNYCLLDLNMPPPLKSCEGEENLVLDLNLGI